MGQYIGVYVIQIDHFPPLISIIGSISALIGMYVIRESYERKNPTPKINVSKRLETEEDEVEAIKLRQIVRQSSL